MSQGPFIGAMSAFQGTEAETRESLGGIKQYNVLPDERSLICPPSKSIIFYLSGSLIFICLPPPGIPIESERVDSQKWLKWWSYLLLLFQPSQTHPHPPLYSPRLQSQQATQLHPQLCLPQRPAETLQPLTQNTKELN